MKNLFRILIITSILLYTLWFFAPDYWHLMYEGELLNAMEWNGWGASFPINNYLIYGTSILYLVSSVGLFFFKNWARKLFLLLNIYILFSTPFYGVVVNVGLELLVFNTRLMIDGAILFMMYITSVTKLFAEDSR